jgi:hypothetical protein
MKNSPMAPGSIIPSGRTSRPSGRISRPSSIETSTHDWLSIISSSIGPILGLKMRVKFDRILPLTLLPCVPQVNGDPLRQGPERFSLRILVLDPPATDVVVRHARPGATPPSPAPSGRGAVSILPTHSHAEEDRRKQQGEPGGPAEAEGPSADLCRPALAVEGVAG